MTLLAPAKLHSQLRDSLNEAYREYYKPSVPKRKLLLLCQYKGELFLTWEAANKAYESDYWWTFKPFRSVANDR